MTPDVSRGSSNEREASNVIEPYDVLVVGGGHAGSEAALAAARMGCRVALMTMSIESIALLPCNPSIGGPAKGHLVREIDALGGQMGIATDETFLQIRMLNTSKGAAVQAPRAQLDKHAYGLSIQATIGREPGLRVMQSMVVGLEIDAEKRRVRGVRCQDGSIILASTVVLTTGTALRGRLIAGECVTPGSRYGEPPALGLSDELTALGFRLRRLKTGTPPRLHVRSVSFDGATCHPGSDRPLFFSMSSYRAIDSRSWDGHVRYGRPDRANPRWPNALPVRWRPQLPCYLIHTNSETHECIRQNIDRAPLFNGAIEGVGPRYCPSIEDKVVRFPDKTSHGLFLEPEGWETDEVYVQGFSTSMPEDVQDAMVHSIPALSGAEILRYGYAVEYDAVASSDVTATMETRHVAGLYVAGQIVGTSGYEEAAAQGLLAGINAALAARGAPAIDKAVSGLLSGFQDMLENVSRIQDSRPVRDQPARVADPAIGIMHRTELIALMRAIENGDSVVLPRSIAYAGVMISDLTSQDLSEPYRLMTARAEHRLLLRADTAELRLSPIAARLGLITGERFTEIEQRRNRLVESLRRLASISIVPRPEIAASLSEINAPIPDGPTNALDYLCRPGATLNALDSMMTHLPTNPQERELIEVEARYSGYAAREQHQVERVRRLESRRIPPAIDFQAARHLRREAREALTRYKPRTIGDAQRLGGVTAADIAALLVYLEQELRNGFHVRHIS